MYPQSLLGLRLSGLRPLRQIHCRPDVIPRFHMRSCPSLLPFVISEVRIVILAEPFTPVWSFTALHGAFGYRIRPNLLRNFIIGRKTLMEGLKVSTAKSFRVMRTVTVTGYATFANLIFVHTSIIPNIR